MASKYEDVSHEKKYNMKKDQIIIWMTVKIISKSHTVLLYMYYLYEDCIVISIANT